MIALREQLTLRGLDVVQLVSHPLQRCSGGFEAAGVDADAGGRQAAQLVVGLQRRRRHLRERLAGTGHHAAEEALHV
ncbi:hypothetical protein D9M71_725400 [compost metagenome]